MPSPSSAAAHAESQFVSHLSAWKLAEQELQSVVAQRAKYASQVEELQLVEDEMALLEPDAQLYKMIGPVLQPTPVADGLKQVQQRVKYLRDEHARCLTREKKLGEQQREKRIQLMEMQKKLPNVPNSIYSV